MIQTPHPADSFRASQPLASEDPGTAEMLVFALSFLRRRLLLLLACFILGLTLAVVYLRATPPTYTATAQVLLDNPKSQYVRQESPLAEPALDFAYIDTQTQIIRSPRLAIAVIEKLHLRNDPDFNRRQISPVPVVRYIRDRIFPPASSVAGEADERDLTQMRQFLGRLEVQRAGFGNIIEISFNSSSASKAAQIANAVADAYVQDQLDARAQANRRATEWLQDRLESLGDQARKAQSAVDAYRAEHNLVSSDGKPIDDEQIKDLNARLVAARAQSSDALARMNGYQQILSSDMKSPLFLDKVSSAAPDALNSPIITQLRTQYLELQRKAIEWTPRYGSNHLAVIDLRDRMRDIRGSIHDEVVRLAQASRNDYEVAQKRQQAIEKQLDDTVARTRSNDAAQMALRDLQARAKGYQTLFDTFQQRYMGAVQLESFPISDVRVTSPALPPDSKSKPKGSLILALGAFGGVAAGFAFGLLRDLMDGTFRTPAQVEGALQVPCLSLVPSIQAPKRTKYLDKSRAASNAAQRISSPARAIDSAAIVSPYSRFAETIRAIKIGIDLGARKTSNKVVGVTSSLPGEGKTTIAAALAGQIAHGGKRVIIVDCDLRHPSLSARFAPGAAAGLIEVASGAQSLESVVWTDLTTNLVILPVFCRAPLLHTSEILLSQATRDLINRLRAAYDFVILDLPPLYPLVDARAAASLVDCFVLAIEWGGPKVGMVRHALRSAPNVHEKLIGAVLNKTNMKAVGSYDLRTRSLYSESHYSRYNGIAGA